MIGPPLPPDANALAALIIARTRVAEPEAISEAMQVAAACEVQVRGLTADGYARTRR